MVRVGFPLHRLASARDGDAGAILWTTGADGDSGGEVHEAGDGAEHADAVMYEADELPDIGFPAQIEHAAQWRVMIAGRSDLNEEDFAPEMIDDGLPSLGGPPFDGDVGFAPGGDDPIRHIRAYDFRDLWRPHFFHWMKMDVAFEKSGADANAELGG